MKHILMASIFALIAGGSAYAQDAATKPDSGAAHPPTERMGEATPTMSSSDDKQHPPTERMGEAVPEMHSPARQAAGSGMESKNPAFIISDQWVSRAVYSSDGKELGSVTALKKEGDQNGIYFDMGGFLGIGASTKLVSVEKIQEVKDDRIVLDVTAKEAENLPSKEEAGDSSAR
jgi:PRC-barrel domain